MYAATLATESSVTDATGFILPTPALRLRTLQEKFAFVYGQLNPARRITSAAQIGGEFGVETRNAARGVRENNVVVVAAADPDERKGSVEYTACTIGSIDQETSFRHQSLADQPSFAAMVCANSACASWTIADSCWSVCIGS
jgi:hypothetical protein